MFVCTTRYRRPLVAGEQVVEEHFVYLDGLYREGRLIASGPQNSGRGGVILVAGDDDGVARDLINNDPLVAAGVVDYELIQFRPSRAFDPELIEHTS